MGLTEGLLKRIKQIRFHNIVVFITKNTHTIVKLIFKIHIK